MPLWACLPGTGAPRLWVSFSIPFTFLHRKLQFLQTDTLLMPTHSDGPPSLWMGESQERLLTDCYLLPS